MTFSPALRSLSELSLQRYIDVKGEVYSGINMPCIETSEVALKLYFEVLDV